MPGENTHRKWFDPAGPANLIGKMADLLEAASTELLRVLQSERDGRLAAANWRAMKPGNQARIDVDALMPDVDVIVRAFAGFGSLVQRLMKLPITSPNGSGRSSLSLRREACCRQEAAASTGGAFA